MAVFVCGRRCGLARETRNPREARTAASRDQLAFGEEPLPDEDQECRSPAVTPILCTHSVSRFDGAWLRAVERPQVAFSAGLSNKESQVDPGKKKMGTATPASERCGAD